MVKWLRSYMYVKIKSVAPSSFRSGITDRLTIQLPNIMLSPHMYSLKAICDVSKQLLEHCGEKFHVGPEARFSDLYVRFPVQSI